MIYINEKCDIYHFISENEQKIYELSENKGRGGFFSLDI